MGRASDDKIKDMAGLLLSKATMLQYHCSECGSPLFKKDKKVFCPKCGELKTKKAAPEKKELRSEGKGISRLKGRRVCIKTGSDVYRGVCEDIYDKTFTVTLINAEKLNLYGKTNEEEWCTLSDLLVIQGNKIEAAWLYDKKEEK